MSDYRKLRTIYDALDAHNFKQSLKLCDAALKKAADTSMVKALKAVTLERMGRTEEGLKVTVSRRQAPVLSHKVSTLHGIQGKTADPACARIGSSQRTSRPRRCGSRLQSLRHGHVRAIHAPRDERAGPPRDERGGPPHDDKRSA